MTPLTVDLGPLHVRGRGVWLGHVGGDGVQFAAPGLRQGDGRILPYERIAGLELQVSRSPAGRRRRAALRVGGLLGALAGVPGTPTDPGGCRVRLLLRHPWEESEVPCAQRLDPASLDRSSVVLCRLLLRRLAELRGLRLLHDPASAAALLRDVTAAADAAPRRRRRRAVEEHLTERLAGTRREPPEDNLGLLLAEEPAEGPE